MSAEFLGFPGNCNGSPAGKIEKNSKNHPQHFDECSKILAKCNGEKIYELVLN